MMASKKWRHHNSQSGAVPLDRPGRPCPALDSLKLGQARPGGRAAGEGARPTLRLRQL